MNLLCSTNTCAWYLKELCVKGREKERERAGERKKKRERDKIRQNKTAKKVFPQDETEGRRGGWRIR